MLQQHMSCSINQPCACMCCRKCLANQGCRLPASRPRRHAATNCPGSKHAPETWHNAGCLGMPHKYGSECLLPAAQVQQSSSAARPGTGQPQDTASAPEQTDAEGSAGPAREVIQDVCQLSIAEEGCVVCWSTEASIIFQPCGHLSTCSGCSQPFLAQNLPCPMCRATVEDGIAPFELSRC